MAPYLMVEQDAVDCKHGVGFAVVYGRPKCKLLRNGVRGPRIKRRRLLLGHLLHQAVQLAGRRLSGGQARGQACSQACSQACGQGARPGKTCMCPAVHTSEWRSTTSRFPGRPHRLCTHSFQRTLGMGRQHPPGISKNMYTRMCTSACVRPHVYVRTRTHRLTFHVALRSQVIHLVRARSRDNGA